MKKTNLTLLILTASAMAACGGTQVMQESEVQASKARAPMAPAPMAPAPMMQEMRTADAAGQPRAVAKMAVSPSMPAPMEMQPVARQTETMSEGYTPNQVKRVSDEPVSTFSMDVDTAGYPLVRQSILKFGQLPSADTVRTEEMLNYFSYQYPDRGSAQQPFTVTHTVMDSPLGKGKKLLHLAIKGFEETAQTQPDSNLVFLIDTSGSMNAPEALPLVKQSFRMFLKQLKPTDMISIVTYAGQSRVALKPTPVAKSAEILAVLDNLNASGSTNGAGAIQMAYELAEQNFNPKAVNRIMLATDGDFNMGINNPKELKDFVASKRESGVYLSVLGFLGHRAFRDDMMQSLAQNGNGIAASITSVNEARKVLVEQAHANLFPIAKDAKVQVAFNPATVSEYRLLGYESRMLQREDFTNDKVDAAEIGSGHTVTAIYEFVPRASGAESMPSSRYETKQLPVGDFGNEYAEVKVRFKLPEEVVSREISQVVRMNEKVPADYRREASFGVAVAAASELLRGGKYAGQMKWDDVIALAEQNRGDDRFGYRSEFLQLLRTAQALQQ